MVFTQACLCPLLSTVFGLLAFFIGYAIAVGKDHVDPWLPYISDCGNLQPESGIFGILLNFSSFFLILTVYFVYRNFVVFEEKVQEHKLGKWKWFAVALMFLGIAAAIGAAMVANFQEGVQLTTHDTGAFLFFIGINIYFYGQILIGFLYRPRNISIYMTIFRLIVCIAITVTLILHLTCLFANPFVKSVNGEKPKKPEFKNGIERYKKGDPYYKNHIVTTLSEWILALLIETIVLSFTYDLSLTCLESPTIRPTGFLKQGRAEAAFYTNQVSPLVPENIPVMRKLPRLDNYGTNSNKESQTGTLKSNLYSDRRVVSNYNQYSYF